MNMFDAAIAAFDAANEADPNRETFDGREWPKELLYARRMSDWLAKLVPDASETLRLAVRAQHIERWAIPRSDYPEGKKGYHLWRTTLYRHHAERAGAILRTAGYDDATIARVGDLLQKKHLRSDPEVQALEDAACLVFLENHFADFAEKHDDSKLIDIVRKTWGKMSETGHKAALDLAGALPERARGLIQAALSSEA